MKLSIIIPMYNIENYIEECLENLMNDNIEQSYEVLIINDGTKDSSREIAEKCIQEKGNFKIIDKSNGGLSSARNKGIVEAKGEYLFFLDGDDFIDINEIMNMLIVAQKENLEILIANGMYYYQHSQKTVRFTQGKKLSQFKEVTTGENMMTYMIENNCYKMEVWDKLYKREFILKNNLFFEDGLLHEDELFTPLALYNAKKVKYYGNIDYYYRQREESINHSIKLKNCLDYLIIANKLYNMESNNKEFKKNLNIRVMQQYLRAIQLALTLNKKDYKIFKNELKKSYFNEYKRMEHLPLQIILRINLFKYFRKLYFIMYKLYRKIRFVSIGKA